MPDTLVKIEAERAALLEKLATTGDMRRGSITEVYRSCGKPNCVCASPDHPGHGPFYAFTTKIKGKTKTLQLRPGPVLSKLEREVTTYRGFRSTCDRLIEVSEAICDARPVPESGAEKKRRSSPRSKPRSSPRSKRS
jgi:hypothetical protein